MKRTGFMIATYSCDEQPVPACHSGQARVPIRAFPFRPKPKYIHISESAIARYGMIPMRTWLFVKLHCWHNGIVYRSWTEQRGGKFGWGRATFFSRMALLVEAGLAEKDPWGNWKLANIRTVVGLHKGRPVKHRCKVPVDRMVTERDAQDALNLKLIEMGLRQKEYHWLTPELRHKLKRISDKKFIRLNRSRLLEEGLPYTQAKKALTGIGSTEADILKFARTGFVPLNTEGLMRYTGLGRTSLFALKKRLKKNGWIEQENRTFLVPPEYSKYLPMGIEEMQEAHQGKFSCSDSGVWQFHQAAMYRPKLSY